MIARRLQITNPSSCEYIIIYDFGFKCVHGHANEITSVEHKVDGNICRPIGPNLAGAVYSRQTMRM